MDHGGQSEPTECWFGLRLFVEVFNRSSMADLPRGKSTPPLGIFY